MENKIIITKDGIIKIRNIEKGILTGFDIIKERLVQIPNNGYIEITEQIKSLLGCEESRLKLARAMYIKDKDVAKSLSITNRTLRRLDIQYLGEEKSKIDYSPANLSEKSIIEIRKLAQEKELTHTQIGNKFNVSNTTVGRIVNKKGAYAKF